MAALALRSGNTTRLFEFVRRAQVSWPFGHQLSPRSESLFASDRPLPFIHWFSRKECQVPHPIGV